MWQSWQYKVPTFRNAIEAWLERDSKTDTGAAAEAEPMEIGVYLWVVTIAACAVLSLNWCVCAQCFFCNNQYRLQTNADDLETVFKARLKGIGKMVAMLDEWSCPVYVTRIWCKCELIVLVFCLVAHCLARQVFLNSMWQSPRASMWRWSCLPTRVQP